MDEGAEKTSGGERMDDGKIIELYFARSEDAIYETDRKYGKYCRAIAYNVLSSNEDANECVNDTYFRVWNSIPPAKPDSLRAFLAKICRNAALNRYEYNRAARRSANLETALDEIESVIPSSDAPPSDTVALRDAINSFVASLGERERVIFVQRYFYLLPIKQIADGRGLGESNVKQILMRTRARFKAHIEKESIVI